MSHLPLLIDVGGESRFLRRILPTLLVLAAAVVLGLTIGQSHWIYLLVLVGASIAIVWPIQVGLGLFAFLIPFDYVSIASSGSPVTLNWLAGVAATALLLAKGLLSRRLQIPPKSSLWWSLFVIWGTITLAWVTNLQMAIQRLVTAWSLLIFYLVTVSVRLNRRELIWTSAAAIAGGLAAALQASWGFYNGQAFEGSRATLMMGRSEADPNYFAASLLFPLALAVGALLASRSWFRRIFLLTVVAGLLFGVALSMSRGALLALLVLALVFVRRLKFKWSLLLPAGAFLSLLLLLPNTFFTRLEQASSTRGAHRLDIWLVGLAAFKDHALVGAGLSSFPVVYNDYLIAANFFGGYSKYPHNIYLETSVELGIIGLALLIAAILTQLRSAGAGMKLADDAPPEVRFFAIACEAGCWSVLVCGFFLGILWFKLFWFPWIMLALALKLLQSSPKPQPDPTPVPDYLQVEDHRGALLHGRG